MKVVFILVLVTISAPLSQYVLAHGAEPYIIYDRIHVDADVVTVVRQIRNRSGVVITETVWKSYESGSDQQPLFAQFVDCGGDGSIDVFMWHQVRGKFYDGTVPANLVTVTDHGKSFLGYSTWTASGLVKDPDMEFVSAQVSVLERARLDLIGSSFEAEMWISTNPHAEDMCR